MSSLGDENEFCEPMVVISLISKDGSTGPRSEERRVGKECLL